MGYDARQLAGRDGNKLIWGLAPLMARSLQAGRFTNYSKRAIALNRYSAVVTGITVNPRIRESRALNSADLPERP
jgi:hypothetical protein